mmetsp:Transcript_29438/g.45528  ORF Transcript_29438/g.45528 Transcript_29438/m.45528 type:complete len:143 (-) Transcript_29438:1144-1572(-)
MWLLLLTCVTLLAVALYRSRAKTPAGLFVAPGFKPYVGHWPLLKKQLEAQDDSFLQFSVKTALEANQKPYSVAFPSKRPIIRVTTEEAARHILKDNFPNYIKIDTVTTRMLGNFLERKEFLSWMAKIGNLRERLLLECFPLM